MTPVALTQGTIVDTFERPRRPRTCRRGGCVGDAADDQAEAVS